MLSLSTFKEGANSVGLPDVWRRLSRPPTRGDGFESRTSGRSYPARTRAKEKLVRCPGPIWGWLRQSECGTQSSAPSSLPFDPHGMRDLATTFCPASLIRP